MGTYVRLMQEYAYTRWPVFVSTVSGGGVDGTAGAGSVAAAAEEAHTVSAALAAESESARAKRPIPGRGTRGMGGSLCYSMLRWGEQPLIPIISIDKMQLGRSGCSIVRVRTITLII